MADTDPIILAKIFYYAREKYYCHMEQAAEQGLQKYNNDLVLKFFRAYSQILQGRVQEGMRELDVLKEKRDVNLCSCMALIYGHKYSQNVDREAVQELDAKLKEERKQSGEMGLYYAGVFLFHTGKYDKAREYIDRMLKMAPTREGLTIKGWIELLSGRDVKRAVKYFDDAMGLDGAKDVDILLGKAKYCELRRNYTGALELINQVVVSQSGFLPALVEKMKIQLALQDWDQTVETAQRALGQDMHCIEALRYQVLNLLCREGNYAELLENQLDEASQQIEFLNEIQQSIGRSSDLAYLSAVLATKKKQSPEKITALLNEAIEIHFGSLKGYPLGVQYFYMLNPDFLIQVVKDLLMLGPQTPVTMGQAVNPVLKRCSQVLDALVRAVPGLMEGLFYLSKVKFLAGDIDAAQGTLNHCLEVDPMYSDGHILMAQIYLYQGNFKLANQSLEVGLSHNFMVRDHPLYHLIKARIWKKQGNLPEAIKTLQMSMMLPGVKTSGKRAGSGKKTTAQPISVNDRVSVFLELAEAHRLQGEQPEAAKVMQDAINEFEGSPEEVRITIANAELSLARGDTEMALGMLRNITPEQPYFVQAREKMADIYLNYRKDKRLYASCYRELVDKHPSPHTCILLGDAYMSIQETDKAIDVYEAALKKNPRDASLASKIGQALVKTHNYGKAINYYEAALKSGGQSFLRHDLAELLLKLRQYDKAEKVLKKALDEEAQSSDLDIMMEHTRYLVLLAKVYQKLEQMEDAIQSLTRAKDMQTRVLKRVQLEQPDAVAAQKQLAADICSQMAKDAENQKDYEKAIKFYKEALVFNEDDSKVMLNVAGLYLTTEDLDACQHQLMMLLKNEKENDAATIMLADLMFRRNEYDSAMFHFQQLLHIQPDHYEALSRLVDLQRRAGKLEEVPKFLELAENASPRSPFEAGFNYCKGLYEWYLGNPTEALKLFNKARKDSDWGNLSTYNMVEICLNPDSDTVGGEVFESVDGEGGGSASDKADSEQMAVRTAERLLKEVKPKAGDLRLRLLENMALIATKQKQSVEKALSAFMEISANEKDHVGALYGMAAAYMVLKQTPRARNQLKRLAKANWTMHEAEDLEKAWLLLSDIFIQGGKYDMATDILKRVLEHNKSCTKAHEYMGFIMEKESSYKDAAQNYENAWKYGKKNNPAIGFKLAFNYLKAKRYVDAIDICHHVLAGHPNYPKIKKEILDKARSSLRV
ncbi:hypothetical protein ScPMuIL_013160 [Solemya velum]